MGSVLGVIPARWASQRFPGKALADLVGRPLVQHVWERARQAHRLDRVVIATDDRRIAAAAERFGAEIEMTDPTHASGSDRVAEVARRLGGEIVVNIQGDEPLIDPGAIDAAVTPLVDDASVEVVTLAGPMESEAELHDPNVIKVVVNAQDDALYFSRQAIPYDRGTGAARPQDALLHIGLFAYRTQFLLQYAGWGPTALELRERLEQLRVLERGHRMRVVRIATASPGIDTPEDLRRLAARMES